MPPEPFAGEPEGTREAIMHATYDALCEHGYADLTIQRIGDEFGKSKSLLYHHYDGKDELLVDFLEYLLDRFREDVPFEEYDSTADRLRAFVDEFLPAELAEPRRNISSVIVALRAEATHDEQFREHFTRTDRVFHDRIVGIVREGVESGEFRAVDPDAVAAFILSTLQGAMHRRVTADDVDVAAVRDEIDAYVEQHLLAEER